MTDIQNELMQRMKEHFDRQLDRAFGIDAPWGKTALTPDKISEWERTLLPTFHGLDEMIADGAKIEHLLLILCHHAQEITSKVALASGRSTETCGIA